MSTKSWRPAGWKVVMPALARVDLDGLGAMGCYADGFDDGKEAGADAMLRARWELEKKAIEAIDTLKPQAPWMIEEMIDIIAQLQEGMPCGEEEGQ